MNLTWAEMGQQWPDACVAWDALGAPFEARFEVVDTSPLRDSGLLDAIAPSCPGEAHFRVTDAALNCRCLRWDGSEWTPRFEWDFRRVLVHMGLPPTRLAWEFGQSNFNEPNAAAYQERLSDFLAETRAILAMPIRVVVHRSPPQRLRGSRAQRKRKRAALAMRAGARPTASTGASPARPAVRAR